MARNTRTFSDIDLTFTPSPVGLGYNVGTGTLTGSTDSDLVYTVNTYFSEYNSVNRNIFIDGQFIGKIKTFHDFSHIQLYANSKATFTDSPYTYTIPGDIIRKYDEESIKASIRNLILTQNFERPFHSDIGSPIRGLLFEPATPMLKILLQRAISDTINSYEPRVNLISVDALVSPDSYEINVTITFRIINTTRPVSVTLILKRTR
jgi:phage baseplate assembly protein W